MTHVCNGWKAELCSPPTSIVPLRHRPILGVVTHFCPSHLFEPLRSEQGQWPDASKTSLRSANTLLSML
jgi:hypothetical protein